MITIKKTLSLISASLLACAITASAGVIFPNPQQSSGEGTAFASAGATFKLTGGDTADSDAVSALGKKLSVSDNGSIEIVIGEAGDEAVAQYASLIPEKTQGYYLSVAPGKVVIAGHDNEGTYYGVQSFLQLTANAQVPALTVTDWPDSPVRGVIEGYYGNPWSQEDCLDMYEFFDHNKMNIFIYGPKNDAYHKSKWDQPYPEKQAQELSELATEGLKHKVHFIWAMHPGNAIEGDNMAKAKAKFEMMYELGIRQFAVFFDDISNYQAANQVAYLNYINREFIKKHSDVQPLIMCPSQYNQGWSSGTYLEDLGKGLDADIEIMWTGRGVVDMKLGSASEFFKNKTGRKPFVWLNYPVTDYGYEGGPLLMSPYEPADANISQLTTAFCSNPMEYYEASKVALYGIGDFTWNAAAYDPWQCWEQALKFMMPDNTDAFRTYCYSNFYYPSNTHGLVVAYDETPAFKELLDKKAPATDFTAYFDKQVATADELLGLNNNRLVTEIKEWIEVYRMQGERGIELNAMRNALDTQNGPEFIESYKKYTQLTDSAANHLSRKGWNVRNFLPKSAPKYVEPYIKSQLVALAEEFREGGYDYPDDLFPAQLIADGNYYIIYKGKLLSNGTGSAGNSPAKPSFRSEIDDVNSARQAWKIRYDMENGRYSIRSAFDDRYINEVCNFGVNDYSNEWNTYVITPFCGYYAIQNAGRGGSNYWTVNAAGTQMAKGSNSEWNIDNFLFRIIPVSDEITPAPEPFSDGEYYLFNNEGKAFQRSGDNLIFSELPETAPGIFRWTLAVDTTSKRIKITQGDYKINEFGKLFNTQYYPEWNSYELYSDGENLAIKNGGRSGTDFWGYGSDGKIAKVANQTLLEALKQFKFRRVDSEQNGISEVEPAKPNPAANAVYDLQGRRVANPSKGLYIINGQKVLIK